MTRHVITAQKQKRKKSSVYWFSHTHTKTTYTKVSLQSSLGIHCH